MNDSPKTPQPNEGPPGAGVALLVWVATMVLWGVGLDLFGAKDEFIMTATVQNFKRLAKLAAIPPPQPIIA